MPEELQSQLTLLPEDVDLPVIELSGSSIPIETEEEYRMGGRLLRQISRSEKIVEQYFEGDITQKKMAYEDARGKRRGFQERFDKVRDIVSEKMEAFMLKRQEEHRQRQQSIDQKFRQLRDSIERDATEALIAGRIEDASHIRAMVELIPKGASALPEIRLEGVAQVPVYGIEITDPDALMRAVVEGAVPKTGVVQKKKVSLFQVRESVVESYVRSMGEAFDWPGVRVTPKISYRPIVKEKE